MGGEVTIRVRAAGLSHLTLSRGRTEPPLVPGAEVAGTVLAAPRDSGFAAGDRVLALCRRGGLAEVAVADTEDTFALPAALSFERGAAVLVDYLTAHFAVVERGGLAVGESVLVRGAERGTGIATVQVARAFGAGRVAAVDGGEDFRAAVRAGGPIDLAVDLVGGDGFVDVLRCLGPEGRAVAVPAAGADPAGFRVNRLLLNNLDVVAADWAGWAMGGSGRLANAWAELAPHLTRGALDPVVERVHGLDRLPHAAFAEGTARGKLVVRL
jgi:NADPH2:quinone reductase